MDMNWNLRKSYVSSISHRGRWILGGLLINLKTSSNPPLKNFSPLFARRILWIMVTRYTDNRNRSNHCLVKCIGYRSFADVLAIFATTDMEKLKIRVVSGAAWTHAAGGGRSRRVILKSAAATARSRCVCGGGGDSTADTTGLQPTASDSRRLFSLSAAAAE